MKNEKVLNTIEEAIEDFRQGKIVILLIDTEKGEIYYDSELKEQLANAQPYRTWLEKNRVELDELKSGRKPPPPSSGRWSSTPTWRA